jgi:hypothetical protein
MNPQMALVPRLLRVKGERTSRRVLEMDGKEHHSRVLKSFVVGFLGAVAALMVAAAVWFAVVQPLNGPGLVWGGSVYNSRQEFKLYLRSKGLSYETWLKRNPGAAPWEPGSRAVADGRGQTWDWKRDALLAVIAALLATIAATLFARRGAGRRPASRGLAARDGPVAAPAGAVARTTRRGLGYVGHGARELIQAAVERVQGTPRGQHEAIVIALAASLAMLAGLFITLLISD